MKHIKLLIACTALLHSLSYGCSAPNPGERIWNIIAETQPSTQTIDSQLDKVAVDFSGVFTALDQALSEACTVNSQLEIVEGVAEDFQQDFSGVFTALDALHERLCTIESKSDLLNTDVQVLTGVFGIPIFNEDVGDTGFTISSEGTYFLAENITYAPSSMGTAAITIGTDNVTLDLNGRVITQTNGTSGTVGIEVTNNNTNIEIKNGAIEDTSDRCIDINANNNHVRIINIICQNNSSNAAIESRTNTASIMLDTVKTFSAGQDGFLATDNQNIEIINGQFLGSGSRGISCDTCTEVFIEKTVCTDNGSDGIGTQTTGSDTIEIRDCTLMNNTGSGIECTDTQNGLITNCYLVGNNDDGIQLQNCNRIKCIENLLDNNTSNNINLTGTTSNCYFFANCLMLASNNNLREGASAGPNSVLGNYALAATFADNYVTVSGNTMFNADQFDQSGVFPSPAPVSWKNMSVRT